MQIRRKTALLTAAVCVMVCGGVGNLPENAVTVQAEETEGTYGDLTYMKYDDYVEITGCDKSVEAVIIPDEIEGLPVTGIDKFTFYRSNLSSVVISKNVTSIGDWAFEESPNLISVTIPDGVTHIGKGAFEACTSLTDVVIPESVTSIGAMAFYKCTSLRSANIPENITSVGGNAFWDTPWLSAQFEDNPLLIVNHMVIDANPDAYYSDLTIPDDITHIGDNAFSKCSRLYSVTIPDSVTSIGSAAFQECRYLTDVTVPDSVTSIGSAAFSECESLTSVTLPDGISVIDDYMFHNCSQLPVVTVPEHVTSIGSFAFSHCSFLTTVIIPRGVESIGMCAFEQCTRLTDIYYAGTEEEWAAMEITDFGNNTLSKAVIHFNSTGPMAGDCNNDDALTVADAVLLQKHLLSAEKLTYRQNADLDGNGVVNAADLSVLKHMLLGN